MSIGKIKMATTAGHNIKVRGPYWKNVLKELLSEVPVIPILLKSKLYMRVLYYKITCKSNSIL
jgi:hypothetical protein